VYNALKSALGSYGRDMPGRLMQALQRLNLAQRFMLATLLIMLAGLFGISTWVGQQIEAGVIRQDGATAAFSVDSFVTPLLQDYGEKGQLDQQHMQELSTLLGDTPLGQIIVAFTVRDMSGRMLYSSDATLVTLPAPTSAELAAAARGEVTTEIDRPEHDNELPLRKYSDRLVKTYTPVRLYNHSKVFAIIEFYQDLDPLQAEVNAAMTRSWLVVGAFMLGMYLLLAVFAKRSSDTIDRQKEELQRQVVRLTDLLDQNQQLHTRVRRAAASVANLHERLLRRIGSELHDGPAQDLSLALMQMDVAIGRSEVEAPAGSSKQSNLELLTGIQTALQSALVELRGISSGLSLPQLAGLSVAETLAHATRAHERRTHTTVELDLSDLPAQVPLPIKITAYRLVQEALNNAFKHAGGVGQQVSAHGSERAMFIQISDRGPGFEASKAMAVDEHLGLVGMRERVESLGGRFEIESRQGAGTKVSAILNLPASGATDGREN
jgi:signal transduction histidine kinase